MSNRSTQEYTRRFTLRLTDKEYKYLEKLLQKNTYCQNLSELIRDMIFRKKITINTYDASLHEVKLQLAKIRNELQAIGVNINQITRHFHTAMDSESRLAYAEKIVPHYRKVEDKIQELFTILSQLSRRWSQK
ncbi:plasmid mobilization protein [Negadavirga shengliensis]|uniref:Plasmid mobilization relaxosome protein MobC n=1 Tax=Negadavirga shengliensis TaxID=1389218 RepID=A0ABV9T0T5_9BACT